MDVPETQLLSIDQVANIPEGIGTFGSSAFVIKRFDRAGGQAVHIEDFAEMAAHEEIGIKMQNIKLPEGSK